MAAVWYTVGSVTATANSGNIVGASTLFLANARVGDAITITGSTSLHQITNIASDTQLTITPVYTGTTGSVKAYAVVPVQGYQKDLADQVKLLLNQYGALATSPSIAAFSTVTGGTNLLAYFVNATTMATTAFSPFSRTILDDVDASSVRNTIGAAANASPTLTGIPLAPTAAAGTSTTQIATTAFVNNSFAPLASPTFTGDPKAPTATVGDSDTSIATTAFVQAAMGAYGLGVSQLGTATDVDAITVTGWNRTTSNSLNRPGPTNGIVLTMPYGGGLGAQIYFANTNRLLYRFYTTASGASGVAWVEPATSGANSNITSLTGLTTALSVAQGGTGVTTIAALNTALNAVGSYSKTNIVGTVSQTSSVPTGAIIETATNANGTYTKWADGTMICTRKVTYTGTISTAINGGYYNGTTLAAQSFAASFIAIPTQSIAVATDSSTTAWVGGRNTGSTTFWAGCYLMELFSRVSQTYTLDYLAIGRWY